jgi:hypothetical protein
VAPAAGGTAPPAFKLKIGVPAGAAGTTTPPMIGKPPVPPPGAAKPPPGAPAPAAGAKPPSAAEAGAGPAGKAAKAPAPGKEAKARARPPLKIILAAVGGLAVLGLGGFLAWSYLFPSPPPPPPPAPVKPMIASKAPAPAPVAATPNATASAAGPAQAGTTTTAPAAAALQTVQKLAGKNFQAVGTAGDALKGEQAQVENILDGKDGPDKPASDAPPPVAAATVTPPAPQSASVAFRAWVDGVKINGVNVSPARTIAIINGRPAKPGDVIDASQGVVFDHVDVDNRAIIFRDRTGATAPAKY